MALPFAHAWAKHHEGHRCIFVVDPANLDVARRADFQGELWSVSKSERSTLRSRLQGVQSVTFMTNSFGSMRPYLKVPERIGYGGRWTRWLLTQRGPRGSLSLPQGERWFDLPGGVKPVATPLLIRPTSRGEGQPTLLLFPGAKYGPAKQWDESSLEGVIAEVLKWGWKVELHGAPGEKDLCARLEDRLPEGVQNLCAAWKLAGLLDHLEKVSLPIALANDSGAMHLLAACGVPTLGLYFSTSAQNTPPAFGTHSVMEADVPCRPCYARTCPKEHYNCRKAIEVGVVLGELKKLASSF